MTSIVVLVFILAKFTEGAWIIVVVGPDHVLRPDPLPHASTCSEEKAFEANSAKASMPIRMNRVIVFVDTYDLPTERALLYCNSLNPYSVRAVHFDIDPSRHQARSRRAGAGPTPRRRASAWRSSSARTAESTARRWSSSPTPCATPTCSAW